MKKLGILFSLGAIFLYASERMSFAEWKDGSWKIGIENAAFKLHGSSAFVITYYNGCTEITPMYVEYSSDHTKIELSDRLQMFSIPDGCSGGSEPFSGKNNFGIISSSLEYLTHENEIKFKWNFATHNGSSRPVDFAVHAIADDHLARVLSLPFEIGGIEASDLNRIDPEGALMRAARSGDALLIARLLENGKNVNFENQQSVTPLIVASQNGHVEVVKLLIAAHANLDHKDYYGMTALMHAASKGHKTGVSQLIAAGADINIQDDLGKTALSIASEKGFLEIVELIEKTLPR